MTFVPPRDKRKDELEERKKQLTEKDEQIDDLTKALERANYSVPAAPPIRTQLPVPAYRRQDMPTIPRRNFLGLIKKAAIGLSIGIPAIVAVNYLAQTSSRLNPAQLREQYSQTQQQSFTMQQTAQQQFVTTQQTTQQNTYQNPLDIAESWPLRNSLQELKDAQFQQSSLSKYVAPDMPKGYPPDMPRELTVSSSYDEYTRFMLGNPSYKNSDIAELRAGLFYDDFFRDVGGMFLIYTKPGGKTYSGSSAERLLSAWENNDVTDQVLLKNQSGTFRRIASG